MSKAGGRPKDEHWSHVKAEKDGKWSCIHCGKLFSGKISVTRIKAHLNKEKGQGIAACSFDRETKGVHNSMASGSSNPQKPVNAVGLIQVTEGVSEATDTSTSGSINHQSNAEINHLPKVAEAVPESIDAIVNSSINHQNNVDYGGMDGSSYIKNAFEREITHLNQLVSDLQSEKSHIEGRVQWLQCRGKKRKRYVDFWLNDLEEMRKRVDEMNNFLHPRPDIYELEIKQLIGKIQKHKEEMPLVLSTEFVGGNFEINIKKMWKLLADGQLFIIGVYGMGGVGKTLLITQLENEIKRRGSFKDVFWVTVSHNFSISRLQHDIAKRMGIKLEEDDERIRAANLSSALETKEKSVLILDDVWKYIDLEMAGIPLKENGIKVIVTTRLKRVCHEMNCLPNNMIQMLPLESHEAEELFKVKLGYNGTPATLPPEVQNIAKCIVNRCDGLPLAISVMARTMKGLDAIHQWKHALNKLEKLETGEEVQEVFKVLKCSYDNLMEKDLQNCFLHCALLPGLPKYELIMELVDNGLINGRSLEEIFVEGKTILDKLEAHSLLQKGDMVDVHVHQSVTDMACRVLKERQRRVMVKFLKEKELTKISHMQEWQDLELVNLMPCNIEEIPEGASPCCPRLSTFILGGRYLHSNQLKYIPNCFFQNMNALIVLNLSNNVKLESLPNSLSELRLLGSLVLKGCQSLKYVPPLGELQALSRLDISYCSLEEVPQGLEKLINLKWLDLSYNENLTTVPGCVDVLPNLTSMQYLDLRCCRDVKIIVEDVQGMNMLECFGGAFLNCEHYNHYVEKILDKGFGPTTYDLLLGSFRSVFLDCESILPDDPKNKTIHFGDCEDFSHSHILPKDLTDLCIYDNDQLICLCGTLSLSGDTFSTLRKIEVGNCKQLKSLFCSSDSCSLCTNIPNLEVLHFVDIQWVFLCEALSSKAAAAALREIKVDNCKQLKSFFCLSDSCSLCTKIQSLEVLRLRDLEICKEDVADVRQSSSMVGMFRCLKYIHIFGCHEIEKLLTPLPNLERIIVEDCNSMKEIFAVGNGDDDDGSSVITLPKLTALELRFLPQLKTVFKSLVLQLPNLERITIKCCDSMEEIFAVGNGDDNDGSSIMLPKLTRMELVCLPQLKTMCKGNILFGSSPTFKISNCPNLKWNYPTLPFQLDINDSDDSNA